jgi:hypothetical protein
MPTYAAVPQVLHTKLKSFPSLEEISALADELQPFFSQTAVFLLPSRQPIHELSTEYRRRLRPRNTGY